MKISTLAELPDPPAGKKGWPWTEQPPPSNTFSANQAALPKISVVVASYNQGGFLEQNIRSVILQGYPNLEYIVIDGGSTDQSKVIIKKYAAWIDHWLGEPDKGAGYAYVKGFAHASGDIFGITCADDFYTQGGLANLMRLRASQPDAVLWAGGANLTDSKGNFIEQKAPFIKNHDFFGNWGDDAWFPTVACLFDAKAYRAAGGLDPSAITGNDLDLWLKLAKLGKIATTAEVAATIRVDPLSLANRDGAATLACMVAVNYRHGHHEVAKKVLERYAKGALRGMSIADILKLRSLDEIVGSVSPAVLARALGRRLSMALWPASKKR